MAGVAQSHIHLRFAWQAWRSWHWVARLGPLWSRVRPRHFAWQAWHLVTSTFVSLGRRGTISHPPSFCVAGVALMALGGALGPALVARDAAALCVAGVALGDIYVRFTWQAWHNLTSTFVLRGRRELNEKMSAVISHSRHFHTHHLSHTPSFTHTYIHACMHAYIHTYVRTYIRTHINTYVHTYMTICQK